MCTAAVVPYSEHLIGLGINQVTFARIKRQDCGLAWPRIGLR